MSSAKSSKSSGMLSKSATQRQISTMFTEKVKKPRMYMGSLARDPRLKDKQNALLNNKPGATEPGLMLATNDSHKRRWRLSQIIKNEREARLKKNNITPSFVFEAPHMDSKRPRPSDKTLSGTERAENVNEPIPKRRKLTQILKPQNSRTLATLRKKVSLGGDALLYDHCMLPKSHALLLDVLHGLESASSLLRTRKTIPTFCKVREIVSKSTRRTFTLRLLSQLAHIVPEAVAVLPRSKAASNLKRPSDLLVIRLDNVDVKKEDNANSSGKMLNSLGDSAARMRRSLLHSRLLQNVRIHHDLFLQRRSLAHSTGSVWHCDFNLEQDVPELPAPPIYPISLGRAETKKTESDEQDKVNEVLRTSEIPNVAEESAQPFLRNAVTGPIADEGIPQTLLERVRAREKARAETSATAEMQRTSNHSLLGKLPCTMDTILSVFRSERRSAMGWLVLLVHLEKVHPKRWSREDLDKQVTAITGIATEWCKKIKLQSSRGGYAFRIVSEKKFSAARANVSSTKSYTPAKA